MRKTSIWLLILGFTVCVARGQDAATQQQIDELSGRIQNILETQAAQNKRLTALEKQISDLGDKLNQPAINDSASIEDLKKLRADVLEIDKKRQADNDQIMKALEKIGKAGARKPAPDISVANPPPSAGGPQKGYEYTIIAGDTLSGIAKAYNSQGVKVTWEQIQAANPGLDSKSLVVGKKIFIPDPAAK